MRTLVLERDSQTVKYNVPFLRSYNILSDGFTKNEIDGIRRVLSGGTQKDASHLSTEVVFDRNELIEILKSETSDLGPAVDSIEIHTDVDEDPVPDDIARIVSLKINNQISLKRKQMSGGQDEDSEHASGLSEVNKLTASPRCIEMIKKFEGFRSHPYICPGGQLTIGYGNSMKPGEYNTITKEQADALLRKTVARFERSVRSLVKVPLNQNQYDALISFAYNVGAGKNGLKGSTLLRKLNASDYEGAAEEFMKWVRADGKVLDGLIRRRTEERKLFIS